MKQKKLKEEEKPQVNNTAEENTAEETSAQTEEAVPEQMAETDNKEVLELKRQSEE